MAVVITRLKHRLECCPARAFAPDDQGRMHLKRMDSNHSLARRATPRRRRSLSTALERPTFNAPTTSARPKAPPGYRRVRRKRPLLFRRPQRSIGSVAKENNPRGKAHHVTRRYIAKLALPLAVAGGLSAKRRTCTGRASNRLRNLTAQGPFPPENVVFLNLWLASQSRTLSPATGTRTSGRLPAQQAPQYPQPTARRRAQRKKRPACKPSGGGRMRGAQAGGCLL